MITPSAPRILIVEDNELISETLQLILGKINCVTIGTANTGNEAVQMARKLKPDAIIMDIEMPDLDGIQAARQIHAQRLAPIVILSVHESRKWVAQAGEVGVAAYLVKPATPHQIERAITIAIARHNEEKALRLRNRQLKQRIAQTKPFWGFIPICSNCKQIRDNHGNWHPIEALLGQNPEITVADTTCPECQTGTTLP